MPSITLTNANGITAKCTEAGLIAALNSSYTTGLAAIGVAEADYSFHNSTAVAFLQLKNNDQGSSAWTWYMYDYKYTSSISLLEFGTSGINMEAAYISSTGYMCGNKVANAYWNDIADFITIPDEDIVEPGYCYMMDEDGHYHKTSEYMQQSFIAIESDTYGFGLGEDQKNKENKLHSAAAGFVLAFVDNEYDVGTPLTCTKDGYLTKIAAEDKVGNPELIIATYWKPEPSELYGTDERKVQVNGRHWVKIR